MTRLLVTAFAFCLPVAFISAIAIGIVRARPEPPQRALRILGRVLLVSGVIGLAATVAYLFVR